MAEMAVMAVIAAIVIDRFLSIVYIVSVDCL